MRRKYCFIFSLLFVLDLLARDPTGIAPAFYGPNAFPIPPLLDGRTSSHFSIDLAGEYYYKSLGNWTTDILLQAKIPLFTPRVNLTLWLPVQEWYDGEPWKHGHGTGDVYVTTDINVTRERRFCPSFTIRAALKTASGEQSERMRHYDSPGYFFDISGGKSFYFNRQGYVHFGDSTTTPTVELRLSATIGFLCWQTTSHAQNDAPYYGIQFAIYSPYVNGSFSWQGYSGWEGYGDKPMSIKVRLGFPIKHLEPYIGYQYGIRDFPYQETRIGLNYQFGKIRNNKKQVYKHEKFRSLLSTNNAVLWH